jgi:hypothetical protein
LGTTRADGYANYFKNFTIDGKQLKLNYIFATRDSRHSQRPRLTIEPTAEEFGLTIDSRFKNKEFLDLADEIRGLPPGSEILVAWHHGKIPRLLQALGADAKALLPNGKWPDDPAELDMRKLELDLRAMLPHANNARITMDIV